MDGEFVKGGVSTPAKALFPEVAEIQARHRIQQRLHLVANAVLDFAEENRSAVVLDDLKGLSKPKRGKALDRRLSLRPRRKLHQYIEHRAARRGAHGRSRMGRVQRRGRPDGSHPTFDRTLDTASKTSTRRPYGRVLGARHAHPRVACIITNSRTG